jgi:hypothetical protein
METDMLSDIVPWLWGTGAAMWIVAIASVGIAIRFRDELESARRTFRTLYHGWIGLGILFAVFAMMRPLSIAAYPALYAWLLAGIWTPMFMGLCALAVARPIGRVDV